MTFSEKQRRERPIGVFDSGIGGLTVVSALRELLPNETIHYLGDTARVPYGGKSAATVERYSLEITSMLLEENCKAIVVACNTASALALPKLEESLSVPVLGVIRPGAEAAVAATRNGHIGVIGTRATIGSGAYERAICAIDPSVKLTVRACPLFVPLIEEGWLEGEITDRVVRQYLAPLLVDGIDTLVLGCTHYPLLRTAIGKFAGDEVQLVDSAHNCATALSRLLEREQLRRNSPSAGNLSVALTDPPDVFLEVARRALRLEIGEVQLRPVTHAAAPG
ncbi:MAG TPA: glutamate racemase [Chthoniobacterales bacterium]|jgi:glutamate racemase